jgi:protein-tyrosine-phosphatase
MSSILFVCTGNVCRSPMAVGLMRRKLAAAQLESRHRAFSAGIWALDGHLASENALAVMAERGIDISDHVAHNVAADDVAEADLILVMAKEHADMIRHTWPQYGWKIHRLAEMAGKKKDVRDPYGESVEAYRACADTISDYIDRGLGRILSLL